MAILHIEHEISDLATWLETFARFAPARDQAGVQQAEVFQPADDPNHIVVNLRFESVDAANNSENSSPSLYGRRRRIHPHSSVLRPRAY
jgi:hypothetical protein